MIIIILIMDDESPTTKLKGDLTEDIGTHIFPRFIISQSNLFSTISEIKLISWEREGLDVSSA